MILSLNNTGEPALPSLRQKIAFKTVDGLHDDLTFGGISPVPWELFALFCLGELAVLELERTRMPKDRAMKKLSMPVIVLQRCRVRTGRCLEDCEFVWGARGVNQEPYML